MRLPVPVISACPQLDFGADCIGIARGSVQQDAHAGIAIGNAAPYFWMGSNLMRNEIDEAIAIVISGDGGKSEGAFALIQFPSLNQITPIVVKQSVRLIRKLEEHLGIIRVIRKTRGDVQLFPTICIYIQPLT